MDNHSYPTNNGSARTLFLVIFAVSFLLLALGYYLEMVKDIQPCVLCLMQRGLFFLVMITSLIAAIHQPISKIRYFYSAILFIFSMIGAAIAGWQLWLQASPATGELCTPVLNSGGDFFSTVQGNCAEVSWKFIGISLPGWSLLFFILFAAMIFTAIFQQRRSKLNPQL